METKARLFDMDIARKATQYIQKRNFVSIDKKDPNNHQNGASPYQKFAYG